MLDKVPGEIICIFKTNLDETYQIQETPLNIQTNFNNKSLSKVLHSLKIFQFIIFYNNFNYIKLISNIL